MEPIQAKTAFDLLNGQAEYQKKLYKPKKQESKASNDSFRPTKTKCPKCGKTTAIHSLLDYANDEVYTFIDCEHCGYKEE